MSVRIKASDNMVTIPTNGTGYPSIDKYWDFDAQQVRVPLASYNEDTQLQDDVLELMSESKMTDQGRKQWVLSAERDGIEFVILLIQIPYVKNTL